MKKVKILKTVITSQHGTLVDGDVLTCGDELANHLVNECKAAQYVEANQKKPKSQKAKKPTQKN